MRKLKNLFIIVLTVTFIFTLIFSTQVLAKGADVSKGVQEDNKVREEADKTVNQEVDEEVDEDVNEEKEEVDTQKGEAKNKLKEEARQAWKEAKDKLEAQKDTIEAQKDGIEAQKEELEKQLEEAEASGNTVLAEQLKQQISQLKEQMTALKNDMEQIRLQMKKEIRSSYTAEELQLVNEATTQLESKYKDVKVLGIDSVIAKGKNIKFDTPPVIKEGRTLIPIRAISEGFGAEVAWNAETHEVTITKGDKVIILTIGSNTVVVNGEAIQIDAKSEIMNGRTVVPLRFIIENLGLKVKWDNETETVEIEDGVQTEESQITEGPDENTGSDTGIEPQAGTEAEAGTGTEPAIEAGAEAAEAGAETGNEAGTENEEGSIVSE